MSGLDGVPKTEAALLMDVPASNRPGAFPRGVLPPAERVLYETRPTLFGRYGGRLIVLILLALLFGGVAIAAGGGAAWGGLFLLGITAIPIIYWVLEWRGTAYALTDRRVLLVGGIRQTTFLDATYAQVQSLNLVSGWGGGLKFDATPPAAPHTLIGTRKFSKKIFWRALQDPSRVQSFVQEAFLLHEREAAQTGLRDALIAKMTENRFPCAYCRTLIDIRTVDFATARCPSCGAPLVIPE